MAEQAAEPDNALTTSTEKELGSAFPNLSDRELEIVRLLAQGMSNKQIGKALAVGEADVKLDIKAVMRKLRLSNRAQITVLLLREDTLANRSSEMLPQQGTAQEGFEVRDLDDILSRLEAGIAQEKSAMSVLLSRLRMVATAS